MTPKGNQIDNAGRCRFATRNLDAVFLSFDEPNADENWADLRCRRPDAKRIDGVKGLGAAHLAAAEAAGTERFVLIDADTTVLPAFWDAVIDLTAAFAGKQSLMFRSRNAVNGLVTGYGGVKIFSRAYVFRHATDENQAREGGNVDFLWDDRFLEFAEVWSATAVNGSPRQAFRAGLREGMKLTARLVDHPDRHDLAHQRRVWCSVGSDVENGLWVIAGALWGTDGVLGGSVAPHLLNDYDWLDGVWRGARRDRPGVAGLTRFAGRLAGTLGGDFRVLSPPESRAFKECGMTPVPAEEDTSRFYENWAALAVYME
jgi:hypothetical protein